MGKVEASVENYLLAKVKAAGGTPYKFVSPARRNVPDRVCTFPTGLVAFVECKATEKDELRKGQVLEFNRLVAQGQLVVVVGSKAQVDEFINVVNANIKKRMP